MTGKSIYYSVTWERADQADFRHVEPFLTEEGHSTTDDFAARIALRKGLFPHQVNVISFTEVANG